MTMVKWVVLRKLVVSLRLGRQNSLIGVPLGLKNEVTGATKVCPTFRVCGVSKERKVGFLTGCFLCLNPKDGLVEAAGVTGLISLGCFFR